MPVLLLVDRLGLANPNPSPSPNPSPNPNPNLIDSWNRMDQMSSCKKWRSHEGLHAREMLVPSMLGADHMPYGAG